MIWRSVLWFRDRMWPCRWKQGEEEHCELILWVSLYFWSSSLILWHSFSRKTQSCDVSHTRSVALSSKLQSRRLGVFRWVGTRCRHHSYTFYTGDRNPQLSNDWHLERQTAVLERRNSGSLLSHSTFLWAPFIWVLTDDCFLTYSDDNMQSAPKHFPSANLSERTHTHMHQHLQRPARTDSHSVQSGYIPVPWILPLWLRCFRIDRPDTEPSHRDTEQWW